MLEALRYIDVSGRKYHAVKRLMDICISAAAMLLLLIPMLILMLCIYIDDPGKVIFAQTRIGRNGKPFKIYKIRTMVASAPGNLSAAEFRDADRYVTRIGGLLRKASLDELPQLFNVLRGDMSIIGPRPLIAEESRIHGMRKTYGVYQTRPGITGLAQVNGRNDLTWTQKIEYDIQYVDNFSLWMDIKILFKTVLVVFGRKGIDFHKEDKITSKQTEA